MKKSKNPVFIVFGAIAVSIILFSVGRGSGTDLAAGNLGRGAILGEQAGAALAPDFTLSTLSGEPITLSSYRGNKPVILDFFATWCPNCRRNIPKESALYKKYNGEVEVIGVNLQENPTKVRDFAERYDIPFPVVLDPHGLASRLYNVGYTNFHVLINKNGAVVRFIPGDIREADFTSLLDS